MNKDPLQGLSPHPGAVAQDARPAEDGAGLGLDIVEIGRVERILARTPRFRMRVFTEGERAHCDKTANPPVHYATRFAAKQAVLKAMGMHIFSGIALADIEIVRPPNSRPAARLHGRAAAAAKRLGIVEIPVSLSFTHSEAVGCALAITGDALPCAHRREDPMKELTAQFKAARAFLDELPARKAGDPPAPVPGPEEGEGALARPASPEGGPQQDQGLFGTLPGI